MKITSRKIEKLQEGGGISSSAQQAVNKFNQASQNFDNAGKININQKLGELQNKSLFNLMDFKDTLMSGTSSLMDFKRNGINTLNEKYHNEISGIGNAYQYLQNYRNNLIQKAQTGSYDVNGTTVNESAIAQQNKAWNTSGSTYHGIKQEERGLKQWYKDQKNELAGQVANKAMNLVANVGAKGYGALKNYKNYQDAKFVTQQNNQQT